MLEDLCKKIVIAKSQDEWEQVAESCIKDNNKILKLDILDEIAQTAADHRLTDYRAAIVYHYKKFSNE